MYEKSSRLFSTLGDIIYFVMTLNWIDMETEEVTVVALPVGLADELDKVLDEIVLEEKVFRRDLVE